MLPRPRSRCRRLKDVTQTLSSDAFEGRAPTTPAEEKTIAYIVERFKAAGLKPGNKGSWFQDVPLVEITASDVSPLDHHRRQDAAEPSTYRSDMVIAHLPRHAEDRRQGQRRRLRRLWHQRARARLERLCRRRREGARPSSSSSTIPTGRRRGCDGLFERPGDDLLRPLDLQVRGSGAPGRRRRDHRPRHRARRLWLERRAVLLDRAAARTWTPRAIIWTRARRSAGCQKPRRRRCSPSAGKDFDALAAAAQAHGLQGGAAGREGVDVASTNAIRRQASKNVIGILPGTTRPDEYVLYTAHWDHLGRCDAGRDGDDICNGAIDNATRHRRAGRARRGACQGGAGRSARSSSSR